MPIDTFTIIDPQTGQTVSYQATPIASFWRRLFALLLDTIVFALIGLLLSLFLSKQFVQMGSYGRLIRFAIVILYFGTLNSTTGQGQSLGKRILKLKVVDYGGNYLSAGSILFKNFDFGDAVFYQ